MTNAASVDCALCILGAGYAGLNGLNVAAKYLPKGARVVFIDRNTTWGGQWVRQYSFVRLHQPHPLFVAGDQPWALKKERSHLASRSEVLDYLSTVPEVSAGHLEIDARFGHEYEGHEVVDGKVHIDAKDEQGRPVRIRADRLLKATGFDIAIKEPFPISSDAVRSVSVVDPLLSSPELQESDAPIYVIGSGKTAMDCVLHLVRRGIRRPIRVIAGRGTYFGVRDESFPTGWRRHVTGLVTNDAFVDNMHRYDGTNAREIIDWYVDRKLVHSPLDRADSYMLGILSRSECAELRAGIDEAIHGHLVDVEGDGSPEMVIRGVDGTQRQVDVPEGSLFVNCTGHLVEGAFEPVLSGDGLVCAPQRTLLFTGSSAYFVTHLWLRGDLNRVADELRRADWGHEPKIDLVPRAQLVLLDNMLRISDHLPFRIASKYLGDFNKWFPLHRQIKPMIRLLAARKMIHRKAEELAPERYSDPQTGSAAQASSSRSG